MKLKTIEIIINGTEKVKQDWSKSNIKINDGQDMFNEMNSAAIVLGNTLAKLDKALRK